MTLYADYQVKTYAIRHDRRPRLDPQAYPWQFKLCAICADPIPVWRDHVSLDGEFVYDEATRLTCYSFHAEMYREGEELVEGEVHDVPYWRPGPDDARETN